MGDDEGDRVDDAEGDGTAVCVADGVGDVEGNEGLAASSAVTGDVDTADDVLLAVEVGDDSAKSSARSCSSLASGDGELNTSSLVTDGLAEVEVDASVEGVAEGDGDGGICDEVGDALEVVGDGVADDDADEPLDDGRGDAVAPDASVGSLSSTQRSVMASG